MSNTEEKIIHTFHAAGEPEMQSEGVLPVVSDDLSLGPSEDDMNDNLSDDLSEDLDDPGFHGNAPATSEKSEGSWDKISDAVLEDHALQIVSIGTESDQYAFTFHDDELEFIMNQVPHGLKVCVVSVVGAFRTGKSFLLSWFLKYLNHHESLLHTKKEKDDAEKVKEDKLHWYDQCDCLGHNGFDWRGGAERNTTGIWMWSKPFILPRILPNGKVEDVALLLVDTQGMFDHETTMGLTAAIFGLSTLLSSYQIYNVDKRIQEDNLQQLALFSEYGRIALLSDGHVEEGAVDQKDESSGKKIPKKPFQYIEFLVRDWQNFEDDEDIDQCEKEMAQYLESVLAEREATDLKDTREQIMSCFDNIGCYLMTHPGFAVTKKKYDGDVKSVEPTFKAFMDRYCKRVFTNLQPKSIHGRELTSTELSTYISSYANMFATGAHFPEAATMLEATANANNSNAANLSIRKYKERMDYEAGPKCSDFLRPSVLEEKHRKLYLECLEMFDDMANFGSKDAIQKSRNEIITYMEDSFQMYSKLNDSRNPLLGMETYIIPILLGIIAILLRKITDFTCSEWSTTCRAGSDLLSHIYQVIFFFMIIVASTKAKQISEILNKFKKAIELLSNNGDEKKKD